MPLEKSEGHAYCTMDLLNIIFQTANGHILVTLQKKYSHNMIRVFFKFNEHAQNAKNAWSINFVWLFIWLSFYVPLEIISLMNMEKSQLLCTYGHWAWRNLYRDTRPRFFRSQQTDHPCLVAFCDKKHWWPILIRMSLIFLNRSI